MILTRKQMDMFRCSDPNCKDPSHELIMHSRCHAKSPTRSLVTDNILELQCARCGKLIFHVAIDLGYGHGDNVNFMRFKCQDEDCNQKHYVIFPKCHDESHTWATYVKKKGILEIRCAECEKLVYTVAVKKE